MTDVAHNMRHSMTYGDADRTRVVWTTAAMTRQASTGSTLDSRKGRHRNMIRGGVRSGGDVRPPHPLDVKRRRPSVGRPDIPCFSPCIQLAAHRALERPAPSGTLPDSECTARQGSASRWSSHRGPSRTSHRLGRVIRSVWPPGRRACFVGRARRATRAALRRRGLGCEGKLVALGVAPDRRHASSHPAHAAFACAGWATSAVVTLPPSRGGGRTGRARVGGGCGRYHRRRPSVPAPSEHV
jgi:hypothetical protein